MDVKILPAYSALPQVRELFSEYTGLLVQGDAAVARYIAIQNYDAELEHLDAKYGLPHGRLYLAFCGEWAAGCCNAPLYSRTKKHFIFDCINTITALCFHWPHTSVNETVQSNRNLPS